MMMIVIRLIRPIGLSDDDDDSHPQAYPSHRTQMMMMIVIRLIRPIGLSDDDDDSHQAYPSHRTIR